ncbi:MAG: hypothetical protein CMJ83_17735 [Planctomycetes bacterium]|nr:hypothetical protein [Planctomycetota bacterium]
MYLGTFLACLGALFLEILATRVLGVVTGPETIYYTVATAMLGMGAAGSLLTVLKWNPTAERARRQAAVLCVLAAVSVVFLFAFSRWLKAELNAAGDRAVAGGGLEGLIGDLANGRIGVALTLGGAMSLPYFFYGLLIALLFKIVPRERQTRLYAADLVGAALGCLGAIVALEAGGFAPPLALAIGLPLLAAAAYRRGTGGRAAVAHVVLAVVAGGAVFIPSVQERLEPQPHLIRLAKLWSGHGDATEEWHTWNSYARVAAVRMRRAETQPYYLSMSLGIGEGHAIVRTFGGPDPETTAGYLPAELASIAGEPRRALILFAGAGRDMISLHQLTQGRTEIVGVELNRQLFEYPAGQDEWNLEQFFDLPTVRMEIAEAREYLELDRTRYDTILMSWSGANVAYYTGAAGHSARFLYTEEAFESLFDHLTDGGMITVLNTNKIKVLAALHRIFERRELPLKNAVIILEDRHSDWTMSWNENRLLVKPSGFTAEDLARVDRVVKNRSLLVRYAPGRPVKDDDPYVRVILATDPERVLEDLGRPHLIDFSVATDDRPFILDLFPARAWLSPEFWSGSFNSERDKPARWTWQIRRDHLKCLAVFAFGSVLLTLGPLVVARRRVPFNRTTFNHLVFFACLGAGFMLVEIGLIQKLGIFLGHPGKAIAVVLGSLILFTGLGSLASERTFRKWLGFRSAAILGIVTTLLLLWVLDQWKADVLAQSSALKTIIVFFALAPIGLALGHLFPQGLAGIGDDSRNLVPWALAINACTGTLAAGVGVPLAQAFGFQVVVLTGLGFYLVAALMRHRGVRA